MLGMPTVADFIGKDRARVMAAIPRYRPTTAPALFSAGFRPFFLLSGLWAFCAVPLWILAFAGNTTLPVLLTGPVWHAHEMVFGFGMATVAGFLLTAVPNWTGRMPLQGAPLIGLVALWIAGRLAMLTSAWLGPLPAAIIDLAFPVAFLLVIGREILTGRNWRNLPVLAALSVLLIANLLVHVGALEIRDTGSLGNRLGIATLLALITLIGGRIVPSFTRNWLAKQRPNVRSPESFGRVDQGAMAVTLLALCAWTIVPGSSLTAVLALLAAVANAVRLRRWRGFSVLAEPLLWVMHLGYAWLTVGLLLVAGGSVVELLSPTAALHALTVGAIGTMTLGVMTRATLGHTGRALTAGSGTTIAFGLVSVSATIRVLAPMLPPEYLPLLDLSAAAWSGAFGLFVVLYAGLLTTPRPTGR
jgi:uncharacterized protein involved in response to NO